MARLAFDLDVVAAVLREAAVAEVLPRFRNLAPGEIAEKRPGDLVTAADRSAEQHLRTRLTDLLPGSVAVGEEMSEVAPELLGQLAGDAPVWVIDPVDGTRNFAAGRADFAMIVALCACGETVAGWLHDPLADVTIQAEKGGGAWLEGHRLTCGSDRRLADMVGSLGARSRERLAGTPGGPARIVRFGSTGRDHMDLVRGTLHFAVYGPPLKPWDHAAGSMIHREAGGHNALLSSGRPYSPVSGIVRDRILFAPTAAAWAEIATRLGPQMN